MQTIPKIMFDAERMKYGNTGLYHYCRQLGNALLQQQNMHTAKLGVYVKKEEAANFQNASFQYYQHSLQKYNMHFSGRFDVWHCTFQGSNYFPFNSKNKIVLTVHDLNFLHEEMPADKRMKKIKTIQKKITRADAIITISRFVKNEMLINFKVANTPVSVIYNGCNINDNLPSVKPSFVPQQPFIFTISVVEERKNIQVLPQLLLNNNFFLIISGAIQNADYKKRIIDAAQALNVQDRILFTGAITEAEKYWYLQNCLVFVFPSIAEGFGLPVIEAMHFGKPVILSKATSLPEIGGSYAYYFNSFNANDMCNTFEESLDHYSKNNMAEKIKNWSEKFNWQTAATQHWEVYESLLP